MKKIIIILFSILFLFSLLIYSQQARIKGYALAYLAKQFETATDVNFEGENVVFHFPFKLSATHLKIILPNSLSVDFTDLYLELSIWKLLKNECKIKSFKCEKAFISRTEKHLGTVPVIKSDLSWNLLPMVLKVNNFVFQQLSIDNQILSESVSHLFQQPIFLSGSLLVDPKLKDISLDLVTGDAEKNDGITEHFFYLVQNDDNINLQFRTSLKANSPFFKEWNLEEDGSINLMTTINGSVATWSQYLGLGGRDELALAGEFQINYNLHGPLPKPCAEGSIEGACSLSNSKLSIDDFHLLSNDVRLYGKGQLSLNDFIIEPSTIVLEIADSDVFNTCFKNQFDFIKMKNLAFKTHIEGPYLAPKIKAIVLIDTVEVEGNRLQQTKLLCDANLSDNAISAMVTLDSNLNKETLHFATQIAYQNSSIQFKDIQGKYAGNMTNGEINYHFDSKLADGNLQGKLNGMFLGKETTATDISYAFILGQNEFQHQTFDVVLDVSHLHYKDVKIENAHLNAEIEDPWHIILGKLELSCASASYHDWSVQNLLVDSKLEPDGQHPISLSFKWNEENSSFQSKGKWELDDRSLFCEIESLSGFCAGHPFRLHDSFTVSLSDQSIQVTPLFMSYGSGMIQANCFIFAKEVNANLQIESLPLNILNFFDPRLSLKGRASGEIILKDNTNGILTSHMELNLHEIESKQFQFSTALEGQLFVDLSKNGMAASGQLFAAEHQPVAFDLILPITITTKPYAFNIDFQKEIAGKVWAEGPLDSLLEFFFPAAPTMSGKLGLAVDLMGTLEEPKLKGSAKLTEGTCELTYVGVAFHDINAQFDLNENKVTLRELSGIDSQAGTLKGTGYALLDFAQSMPFDFNLSIEQGLIQPTDYAKMIASANFHFYGNYYEGFLEGTINSNDMQVTMPEKMRSSTHTVDVTYINQPADRPAPTLYFASTSTWPLHLQLQLTSQKGMISGKDWTSEWKGNVAISGTNQVPLYHGSLQVVKGEYRFNGKAFNINEGAITFAGEWDKKTSLYVVAHKEMDGLKAEIVLKGLLNNPGIMFRSNPPMPQQEILSWILFNRGVSEITPFQGSQLNESITELNMSSDKPDMLTRIKNRFGVDKIDISRGEGFDSNEVSLQVGKYVSRGLLISIQKSVTAETNRLGIEADLMHNIKAQAEVGDDADAQFRLKWKKDY